MSKDKMIKGLQMVRSNHEDEVMVSLEYGEISVFDLVHNVIKTLCPKPGHWIREEHPDGMPGCKVMWRCSDCDTAQSYGKTAYCPFCGRQMEDGKEQSE